jgi:hypothetical protein
MGEIRRTKENNDMCIGSQASNLIGNLQAKSPHGATKRIYLFVDYTTLSDDYWSQDYERNCRRLIWARVPAFARSQNSRVLSELRKNRSPPAQMVSAVASDQLLSI